MALSFKQIRSIEQRRDKKEEGRRKKKEERRKRVEAHPQL